ncbi:pentapeptide repeat-containing protein [Streptosporangium subroseum]|uniref:pentapeptide repeat-containing protein n=1 Tax=Streptosporangium subroseum TaxID=106412 RepID=UPI0030874CBE|nr:pentapeptide repeat-containing protein [Streptosporangium subroseum]
MRLPERLRRRRSLPPDPLPADLPALREPRPAGWWIVPAALLVGGAVYGVAWWLLSGLPPVLKPAEVATARQGAIQTALAAGAGIGAAITVMLAFRRQRHQELATLITSRQADRAAELTELIAERNSRLAEQVAEHNKQDATERRITELYIKAVEQLGSGKAAVRLGGLYALERLAQGDPDHRQTIVNVICAYLRMPYTVPGAAAPGSRPPGPWRTEADSTDQEGERQVRLTAQRILAEHLRDKRTAGERQTAPADRRFWEGMRIDLTGAVLIQANFSHCQFIAAEFDDATFVGGAWFKGATFSEGVQFLRVKFSHGAFFNTANFSGSALFFRASFVGDAQFAKATFAVGAMFDEAKFGGDALFTNATFINSSFFLKAAFNGNARFEGATFNGDTQLAGAIFKKNAEFNKAAFNGNVSFGGATFNKDAQFAGAAFNGDARFTAVTFYGGAKFGQAIFAKKPLFEHSRAMQLDAQNSWPMDWTVVVGSDDIGRLHSDGAVPPASATP